MQRTLLLVDDEENILASLTRLFRQAGYRLLKANGGRAGLEVLAQHEVGVIVSDQRMPEMTGVEFLSQVKDRYPDTVRIMMSGYTDLQYVADAINKGEVYKFLTKPWDDELLRANVEEAFRHYELRRENERLTRELRQAVAELEHVNATLEQRVEQKTREIVLNLRVLQMSQGVLEHLPLAVLGIGDDGIIAVANRQANALLHPQRDCLVGQVAANLLPEPLTRLAIEAIAGATPNVRFEFDGRQVEALAQPMSEGATTHGAVVALIPSLDSTSIAEGDA